MPGNRSNKPSGHDHHVSAPASTKDVDSSRSEKSSTSSSRTSMSNDVDLEQGQPQPSQKQEEKDEEEVRVPWEKDPANPLNWPKWKRIYHTLIPAGCAFACTIASSIYTPGIDGVRQTFNVSNELALLPYSFYVLGLAFGPTISAPLSETYGRRAVYRISVPIFAFFIMGSGFSQNIWTFIILRFFAGFFGSPSLSIGSATISEVWPPAERAIPMSAYVATPFMGPALGPLIGGYATMGENWRWTAWTTIFFSIICLAPVFFGMEETYKAAILRRRAKNKGTVKGEEKEKSKTSFVARTTAFFRKTLARPLYMLFTEPIPGLFALYVGFNFAVQYSFFAAFPLIFEEEYGFNIGQVGLTFLGLGVGVLFGVIALVYFNLRIYKPWVVQLKTEQAKNSHAAEVERREHPKATAAPAEWRLFLAFPGSLLLPIALFLFAWTAGRTHWIVPVIAEALFGMGQLLIFMSATMYVLDCYGPLYGASAMAANTMLRYVLGAAFPLFAVQMYENLGTDWATSLLAFVSCALAVIPWAFWKWGPVLRRKAKFKHEQ